MDVATNNQVIEMAEEIVQLSIRINKDIRQQVKILALQKDTTVNDLVTKFIIDGLTKEKE